MTTSQIVQKVWNYCHTLRDDGVSYDNWFLVIKPVSTFSVSKTKA